MYLFPSQGEFTTTNPMFMGPDLGASTPSPGNSPVAMIGKSGSNKSLDIGSSSSSMAAAAAAGTGGAVHRGALGSFGPRSPRRGNGNSNNSNNSATVESPVGMLSERTSSESTGEETSPAALRAHLSSGGSSSAGGQQAVGTGEGGRGRLGTPTAASAEREGATTAAPGLQASEIWGPSELYGELRDVSPSLSPGVVSDSSGPEVGEGPYGEVEELGVGVQEEEMEDRRAHQGFSDDESSENSDDAAASEFAGGVGRALSRSLSNRGAAATAGAAGAGSSSRSDLGTRVERSGSATRSSAAAVAFQSTPAGVAVSGAAAEVGPPASVSDVQDVGSTAAAIAMVERSMERERQGDETAMAATGPASPQEGRRRRNSGTGLSVLRNTWQGGAVGGEGRGGGLLGLSRFLFVFCYYSGG